MSNNKNENSGCGCANIPISLILLVLGGGYWWLNHQGGFAMISKLPQNLPIAIPQNLPITIPGLNSTTSEAEPSAPTKPPVTTAPSLPNSSIVKPNDQAPSPTPITAQKPQTTQTTQSSQVPREKKVIRGIYIGRYNVTNNASEEKIRKQVRHYHSQGINTIIHGVWGNICPMYTSEVMQKTFGYKSCPNLFRDRWLTWLIDEAHKHGMEVHAYFEKGIKIDKNSPIFDLAIERKWVVPGVDRTYPGIEHYILDVEIPEVANFFRDILVEFVQKYPKIDAVQWDDYLGYHAELPGKVNRTNKLTAFSQEMIGAMKQANPKVSFDLCHHNPYWAKKYFAADWPKWNVDRVFIQAYNDQNFTKEVDYAETYDGIAISDQQFHRLPEIVANNKIKGILVFPNGTNPEDVASKLKQFNVK
ncbi:MAG: family 10 glycosylhydrolase [Moorea sp. SIO2I5]|nr:family 10 glycosylhydrolase [Moorena sp. SIO2I5]